MAHTTDAHTTQNCGTEGGTVKGGTEPWPAGTPGSEGIMLAWTRLTRPQSLIVFPFIRPRCFRLVMPR